MLRLHLIVCGRCRAGVAAVRAERAAVSAALAALGTRGTAADGWARFAAVTGHRPRTTRGARAATLLLLLLPALGLLYQPRAPRLADLDRIARQLAERPEGAGRRPAPAGAPDVRFVEVVDALRKAGQAEVLRDECCADHDAEGPPDDGLLALRVLQPATSVLVMYDDVDRSRSLSRGDLVRWVSLTPEVRAAGSAPIQLAAHLH